MEIALAAKTAKQAMCCCCAEFLHRLGVDAAMRLQVTFDTDCAPLEPVVSKNHALADFIHL
jgi:hypothetical protein